MIRNILATLWMRLWKRSPRSAFVLKAEVPDERHWIRWAVAGITTVVLALLFPGGRSLQFADLKEGSISTRRVVAPFNFEILKTESEVAADREAAVRNLLPVCSRDPNAFLVQARRLDAAFEALRRGVSPTGARSEAVGSTGLTPAVAAVPAELREWASRDENRDALNRLQASCRAVLADVLGAGVLNLPKAEVRSSGDRIVVSDGGRESAVPSGRMSDSAEARRRCGALIAAVPSGDSRMTRLGEALLDAVLRPNVVCDTAAFRARRRDAVAKVPLASGFVYENEKILDRNERITPDIRQKLVSLSIKAAERNVGERGIGGILPLAGRLAFVAALFFILAIYTHFEDRRLLAGNKPTLLFSLILLLVGGITFFLRRGELSENLAPAAVGAMLLASVFDARIAFAGTTVLALLVGGLWGNAYGLTLVSVFTGVTGILVIKRVRNRSQLVEAVILMAAAQIFSITVVALLHLQPAGDLFKQWGFGALNGLFTPILAYGILVFFETLFDITTDFSLLELSNLNHPLLKRLSVEAPGTYHHSIMVGNLAEAAAEAVGANPLLARVGSYYHDVGKIEKSEYFVENQTRGKNPHRKLAPRMSALILENHVKTSLELADQYRLPSSIRNIMEQHHGRSLMSFFYQKAVTQGNAEEVNEEDYRYPGPKPRSKESAVVMLADSVEAASRSLRQPTHSRLKGLIEDIVDERFKAGELDESPLTLRDLERIKEAFLAILAGNFHARVEYPDREPVVKPKPALNPANVAETPYPKQKPANDAETPNPNPSSGKQP
jgi:cyclic-di-AMP phosphodiesterase PgpH